MASNPGTVKVMMVNPKTAKLELANINLTQSVLWSTESGSYSSSIRFQLRCLPSTLVTLEIYGRVASARGNQCPTDTVMSRNRTHNLLKAYSTVF